jgi:hypothetical protein
LGGKLLYPEALDLSMVDIKVNGIAPKSLTLASLDPSASFVASASEALEIGKSLGHERFVAEVFKPLLR